MDFITSANLPFWVGTTAGFLFGSYAKRFLKKLFFKNKKIRYYDGLKNRFTVPHKFN